MAYKESNPAKMHLVQFTVLLSIMIFSHFLILMALLVVLIDLLGEGGDMYLGFIFLYPFFSCFSWLLPIYVLVVFSLSLWRRGIYGEEHSRSAIFCFLFGIIGTILPFFLMIMAFMTLGVFERAYLVLPLLIGCVPLNLILGMYFFVKDIGGKKRGIIGLLIYVLCIFFFIIIATVSIFDDWNWSQETWAVIVAFLILVTIMAIFGLAFLLLGFIDAFKWTDNNKPLIDTEQKQQMEMQQYQIQMQQRTLELQREQIDMQKEQLKMLSEVRTEVLEGEKPLIGMEKGSEDGPV